MINNKQIYDDHNIIFKKGILLYGKPGTGKSTFATQLASDFKIRIHIINVNELSYTALLSVFKEIKNRVTNRIMIVLLEEIDLNLSDDNEDSKRKLSALLTFLDSPLSSPKNTIFIATTNNIKNLPDNLVRSRRFDVKMEITDISEENANKMIDSYNLDIPNNEILEKVKGSDGLYNPSDLITEILKNI